MTEEQDLETYLSLTPYKICIYLFNVKTLKNIYTNELHINNKSELFYLNSLEGFLDKNIFKIEKLVGTFIKNICVIIENDNIFHLNIGIKNKNYQNNVDKKKIESLIIDAKDLFIENYQNQKIMHIVINKYLIDDNSYNSFSNILSGDHLRIEVNFRSISYNFSSQLVKVLEKYQIKIVQFIDGYYIKNYFDKGSLELSDMAHKIIDGHNENEVRLVPKNVKNNGFFEKFFQLFS